MIISILKIVFNGWYYYTTGLCNVRIVVEVIIMIKVTQIVLYSIPFEFTVSYISNFPIRLLRYYTEPNRATGENVDRGKYI